MSSEYEEMEETKEECPVWQSVTCCGFVEPSGGCIFPNPDPHAMK